MAVAKRRLRQAGSRRYLLDQGQTQLEIRRPVYALREEPGYLRRHPGRLLFQRHLYWKPDSRFASRFLQELPPTRPGGPHAHAHVTGSFYINDNWRVTNRLTVILGARWEIVPHAYD